MTRWAQRRMMLHIVTSEGATLLAAAVATPSPRRCHVLDYFLLHQEPAATCGSTLSSHPPLPLPSVCTLPTVMLNNSLLHQEPDATCGGSLSTSLLLLLLLLL